MIYLNGLECEVCVAHFK